MNFLSDIYKRTLAENEKNIKFWEDYLKNLNSLDFNYYSEKLTVPILVPIGNRILFRGNLKHTNEVTVALGADYFAKCSIKQAEILRQHRIKDANSKLETYYKEKEYLENQISFSKENIYNNTQRDIIEHCSEEEDRAWREKHRERVKAYHQSNDKKKSSDLHEMNDEELWSKLEELELQEELKNELSDMNTTNDSTANEESEYDSYVLNKNEINLVVNDNEAKKEQVQEVVTIPHNMIKLTSRLDLLQQVIDRQKALEKKLIELKYKERAMINTKEDYISRLDEIEQLDELEDEYDRLDDILEDESNESNEGNDNDKSDASDEYSTSQQTGTGCEEDDDSTLELNFKHSSVEPSYEPYDSSVGVEKPSDVYEAFSNCLSTPKSILKKTKYGAVYGRRPVSNKKKKTLSFEDEILEKNRTIIINDVVEKSEVSENQTSCDRPKSIFKQMREQQSQAK